MSKNCFAQHILFFFFFFFFFLIFHFIDQANSNVQSFYQQNKKKYTQK